MSSIVACGACGAPIRVVATTSCARLKLDRDPVEHGDVVIGEIAGVEVAVRPLSREHAEGLPLYRTHVRTCPATVRGVPPIGSPADIVTGPALARPHPFGRRNSGGNPGEETESSEQP